ncbi:hypothetical protein LR48_Vigan07g004300 [Vigna angularis]|uniref:Uncharacterized protein n=1 Tax=Phaseolus angularis TaxID=3914 RepID=A0A0L9UUW9_PHAAN|nr:hypothetical protein LR48_Vigan07g004300 [Vigna angularis]
MPSFKVHIPASSVFDDSTYLNALFDEESVAHNDRHAVFDDVKVDLADFENACTDLGLELELEFAGFLNSLELNNEKLQGWFWWVLLSLGATLVGGNDHNSKSFPASYEFNALDLFKVEPIEPTLDYVPVMPAHTHILDSAFSIENIDMPYAVSELCTGFDIIPVDDSFTVGVHSIADLVKFDKEAVDTETTSVKAGDSVNTAQRAWK